jgi:O-methyltransferase involved in polyketide biosynthesis
MEAAPSTTAMLAALARGWLRMEATPPWVLDDAFALVLVGPVWQELHERVFPLFPNHVLREIIAALCIRSRYVEDRLTAGAFAQYVILGAGLDSFAWRRPDLLRSVKVFEVDHPARTDLQERYFADRTDALRPYNVETLVTARVT